MVELDLSIDDLHLHRIRQGAVIARGPVAAFDVQGTGVVDCLQGLLTNDLVGPGAGSLVYGALLTPKGMIVVDLWALRRHTGFTLLAPAQGREATAEIFSRSLPPRLARAADLTGEIQAAWMIGEQAVEVLEESNLRPLPEGTGRVAEIITDAGSVAVARPQPAAPFQVLLAGTGPALELVSRNLEAAGAIPGETGDLEAARILAGWPALGAEIDTKTLPQEVRYDEIGGVSYTKGCYTGQETVARLHFRGHTNRGLRGLVWDEPLPLSDRSVICDGREVGSIRSTLLLARRRIGLAPIRREIHDGETVTAGGQLAWVVALPFSDAVLEA